MTIPIEILRKSWFLAGPTACGKTALSIQLAKQLNAEIISLDSMAIYRGMNIGTAKPSQSDRDRVPHHLIDVADPHQEFSVAEFSKMAVQAAIDIDGRNRTVLFVGGTGLYLRSMLRGLFDGPVADWSFRNSLIQTSQLHEHGWLHEQLMHIDPVTAARLHRNDERRIVRALEVFHLTGQKLSDEQTQQVRPPDEQPALVAWLCPPRDWLHRRIDARVDLMMEQGLLAETQSLLEQQPAPGRTATQALGYRELIDHLHGHTSLQTAVEKIKVATRQFAKRQHTWFRNLAEAQAVEIHGLESTDELITKIHSLVSWLQPSSYHTSNPGGSVNL